LALGGLQIHQVLDEFFVHEFRIHGMDFYQMAQVNQTVQVYFRELHGHPLSIAPGDLRFHFYGQKGGWPEKLDVQSARGIFRKGFIDEKVSAAETDVPHSFRNNALEIRGYPYPGGKRDTGKLSFLLISHLFNR
jgi:hypothetical protein